MIDEGKLTSAEKNELLKSIEENITAVETEIQIVITQDKPKKLEKLQEKIQGLLLRKETVSKMTTVTHLRLKHWDEIFKLWLKLLPLLTLEEKGNSMSLTLADLKTLSEKPDIEANIIRLETASKGMTKKDFFTCLKLLYTYPT